MRTVQFHPGAFKEFYTLTFDNPKTVKKIVELKFDILKDPFNGIGKPEPLKHDKKGYWSRRITDEHRLIYKVSDDVIIIIACKHHYSDK